MELLQSVKKETFKIELEVNGTIPSWIEGVFLRNGPAKFEVENQKMRHWFDGYAMIHKFEIKNGKVNYANKFLKSKSYIEDEKKGNVTSVQWGTVTDPCASVFNKFFSIFKPFEGDNTNVNIAKIDNRFFAISDYSTMVEFDKKSLETKGQLKNGDAFDNKFMNSSAHPSYHPKTGDLYNALIDFSPFPKVYLYKIKKNSTKRIILKEFKVSKPIYFHSVALTEDYFIFIEQPTRINVMGLLVSRLSNKSYDEYINWSPKYGNIYHVYNLKTGELTQLKGEAFFFFHTANCFQTDEKNIQIDLCKFENFDVNKTFYLNKLKENGMPKDYLGKAYRISLNLREMTVSETKLSNEPIDLPQFNKAYSQKDYEFMYGLGINDNNNDFLNQIVKTNVKTGKHITWYKEGYYPSEPIFIANPEAKTEDDGVLISMVLDKKNEKTKFYVLDAKTLETIATADTPACIPPGLHGNFYEN